MPTPNDTAAVVPARTGASRWRNLFIAASTVFIVGVSMWMTGFQVWRMRTQLGTHSTLDAILMTATLALIPSVFIHQLARTWTNRWTHWLGVVMISVVGFAFALGCRDYFAAHGVDRPWSGAFAMTFIASLGPLWLATIERDRALTSKQARQQSEVEPRP